jgi:hypothetical protein
MTERHEGPVAPHTAHYLDVVDKYRADRLRSYHYHHLTINFRIDGPIDAGKFATAVRNLAAANPALRSAFARRSAGWVQRIGTPEDCPAFRHDVLADSTSPWFPIARAAVDALNDQPLDVETGPLFAVTLMQFKDCAVVLTKWHHIVCDGWGILVALNQLLGFYNAELAGVTAPIPAQAAADYLRFAAAQNEFLASPQGRATLQAWRGAIGDHAFIRQPLAERPKGVLGVCSRHMTAAESAPLLAHAERHKLHPSYLIHAAFLRGLEQFVGSDDLLVTFVKANREPATGGVVANFADWVMVRHRLVAGSVLTAIAGAAQRDVSEAKDRYLPYWHILRELAPGQYFNDFGVTPYSFDFVPPLQPKVDVGGLASFTFLHELDAIPFRLTATDIFCRMSLHTHGGDAAARIAIDLIHHAGYLAKTQVESVLDRMNRELQSVL